MTLLKTLIVFQQPAFYTAEHYNQCQLPMPSLYCYKHIFTEHFVLFFTTVAPPKILSGTTLQEINNGTSLITCEVDRGIPLATISWYRVYFNNEKENEEHLLMSTIYTIVENNSTRNTIVENNNTRFTIVGSNLNISDVRFSDDEGNYRIRVVNNHGQDELDILAAFGGMCMFIHIELQQVYTLQYCSDLIIFIMFL